MPAENDQDIAGPPRGSSSRRRRWLIAGIAIVLITALVAVGAVVVTSQIRVSELTAKAEDHAAGISAMAAEAGEAVADQHAARTAAAAYLAEVAEPTSTAVKDHPGDFSVEAGEQMAATVSTLTEQIATAANAPNAVAPGERFDGPDLATRLAQRYIEADDDEHESFDQEYESELRRLDGFAVELTSHIAGLGSAVGAVDGAIAGAAAVGAGTHQPMVDANPLASDEAKATLAASVSALQTIAGLDLSVADEVVAEILATAPVLFTTYVGAAAQVRASQVANTPVVENRGGGGRGGSSAPNYCSRYTAFFGLIWAPC